MGNKLNINGRFLLQKRTGVQRFAIEVCRHLVNECHADLDVYVANDNFNDPFDGKVRYIIPTKQNKSSFLYEQFILPFSCTGYLYSLGGSGPFLKAKQMVVIHDAGVWDTPYSYKLLFILKHRVLQRMYKFSGCGIATVSQFSKIRLQKSLNLKRHILTLTNGWEHCKQIKLNIKKSLKGQYKKNFVLVASRGKHKGLLEFFATIEDDDRFSEFAFHIIGGQSMEFKNFQMNKADNIFMYDFVDDSVLYQYINSSNGLISPSLYEGFGIPPLEALYFRKKLVLNDIPVYRELYSKVANFFQIGNADSLYEALISTGQEDYTTAREVALEKCSWATAAKLLLEGTNENYRSTHLL